MTESPAEAVWRDVCAIRDKRPLVHNITNYVVMNTTANALLALGASPVMAHAEGEVEELVQVAGALVVNIGTLSERWVVAMGLAVGAANAAGVPWVLDPVGAGATFYRSRVARELSERGPSVIRGNASEILALAGENERGRGVDATHGSEVAIEAALSLAEQTGAAVAVTGVTDVVAFRGSMQTVRNGHSMMARVTGMGCTASALVGAFLAVQRHPAAAATHALTAFGVAGEVAAAQAAGPGSFQVAILDALYTLDAATLRERGRIE